MSQTVSDFVFARLHQWGIHRVYGFPGDGVNGLFTAMDRFMQCAAELAAPFAPRSRQS